MGEMMGKKNPPRLAGWNPICHEIGGDEFIMVHRKMLCQSKLHIVSIEKSYIRGGGAMHARAILLGCINIARFWCGVAEIFPEIMDL